MNELGILYRYLPTELAPPKEVWDRLEKVLNDSERGSLSKMDTVELSPPPFAWEKIALALDEENKTIENNALADKFIGAELAPPAFVWDKIQASLDLATPVRKIGMPSKTRKMVAIGLAIAACLTGVVFLTINNSATQNIKQDTQQFAAVQKTDNHKTQNTITTPEVKSPNSQQSRIAMAEKNKPENAENNLTLSADDFQTERETNLEKTKASPVPLINSTNNKVASFTSKLKDASGNIIDKISDHITNAGFIAAIGPNGNSVNVSSKLSNMIEFFHEDSVANSHEEYLDKVMRESNVWRLKWLDWRKKVENADADPSQMNFLDPIDLIHFFQKNK